MAANRKGIGPTTLKRALQRLAHLRPEGERDGPKLPDCS